MQQERIGAQQIELTREISFPGSVFFDSDAIVLQGSYADQLSAYRARKTWVETLESCFLLDQGHDFVISVHSSLEDSRFNLICEFKSACARYAFWRLTNHQAPEAEYLIETAHIPTSESRHEDFLFAPDMRSVVEESLDESYNGAPISSRKHSVLTRLNNALCSLLRRF